MPRPYDYDPSGTQQAQGEGTDMASSGRQQHGMNGRTPGKVRVAILFGGQSDEHDVSLRSAQTVLGALDPDRYEAVQIGITREGRWLAGADPMRQLTARSPLFGVGPGAVAEPDEERGQ